MVTPINDWELKNKYFYIGIAPYGHPAHWISILGSLSQAIRDKFREILQKKSHQKNIISEKNCNLAYFQIDIDAPFKGAHHLCFWDVYPRAYTKGRKNLWNIPSTIGYTIVGGYYSPPLLFLYSQTSILISIKELHLYPIPCLISLLAILKNITVP